MIKSRNLIIISSVLLFISLIVFLLSFGINEAYFTRITYGSVISYEIRQFFALVLLVFTGFFALSVSTVSLSPLWTILLSLPIGCSVWSIASIVVLICGIPYTMAVGLVFSVIPCLLIGIIRMCKGSDKGSYSDLVAKTCSCVKDPLFKAAGLIFLGAALICAAGFVYSFVSYDSFFYFINYGHALNSTGSLKALMGDNTFTLTNIGQFLPMLCAYMSFWGIDQTYSLQAFLSFDIVFIFFYSLYELLPKDHISAKKHLAYCVIFTLLLCTSTAFIINTAWMLANMYCMVYIFLAFICVKLLGSGIISKSDAGLIMAISYLSLTLTRKDGIIFSAFLFICLICESKTITKREAALIFLPAALGELFWLVYVRLILEASVSQSAPQSIANNKNIIFILAIIAGSYIYLFFIHRIIIKLSGLIKPDFINEYVMLLAGMCLLLIPAFIVKGDVVIDNADFTIRNIFLYPSAWGISGIVFGILLVLSLIKCPCLDSGNFLWLGYVLLNFIAYTLVDSKWLWVNWDDSYSRVLMQIIPAFLIIMAIKIYPLFKNEFGSSK